jgi:hypothetical protein
VEKEQVKEVLERTNSLTFLTVFNSGVIILNYLVQKLVRRDTDKQQVKQL